MPDGDVGVKNESVQFAPLKEYVQPGVARHNLHIPFTLVFQHILLRRLTRVQTYQPLLNGSFLDFLALELPYNLFLLIFFKNTAEIFYPFSLLWFLEDHLSIAFADWHMVSRGIFKTLS
jgi:hypothetical protein